MRTFDCFVTFKDTLSPRLCGFLIQANSCCCVHMQGILGMCVGEKRKLKIPPSLGYGKNAAHPLCAALCRLTLQNLQCCNASPFRTDAPNFVHAGDAGAGAAIPGGATLIFETELVKVDRN